jgi:hypothetical protein
MLDNFINGNLTTAKRQAKRFPFKRIYAALMEHYGYSSNKAALTAQFLKGKIDFHTACDAQ